MAAADVHSLPPPHVGRTQEGPRRLLPRDESAEASVLGGILIENNALAVVDHLEPDAFYNHKHKIVFQAIRNLQAQQIPIDVVTLEGEIEKQGKLEAIGGVGFLGELALRVPTAANVEHYGARIRDLHLIREVALVAGATLERAYRWEDAGDEFLGEIVADLSKIERTHLKGLRRAPPGGRKLVDVVKDLARNRTLPVFKTGLPQVDEHAPLMGGHVIVLIGGSGSGKSTLTLQIAQHHATTLGPALMVSLELSGPELGARIVSRECDVSWFAALRGDIGDGTMRKILANERIRVVDDFASTPSTIRSHIIALQREFPDQLVLVVIDYVQILEAEGRDERERVKRAIEGLRSLAKDLGVVLLLVSQSSRDGAKKLRSGDVVGTEASATGAESSQIERAAYVTLSLGEMTENLDGKGPVVVNLSIGKARMGRGDRVVPLEYDGRRGAWSEVGEVVTAAKHKADKSTKKNGKRIVEVGHAVSELLSRSATPMSRVEIREELGINNKLLADAVAALLAEEPLRVAQVQGKKSGGAWPLWTPTKAEEAGIVVLRRLVQ